MLEGSTFRLKKQALGGMNGSENNFLTYCGATYMKATSLVLVNGGHPIWKRLTGGGVVFYKQ